MEIENETASVIVIDTIDVEVPASPNVKEVGAKALEISFDNNEYSIVGDDMVILTRYQDAPQWLKDTIDNTVAIQTAVAVGNLDQVKEALDIMLGELDIAKNTYQLSIVSSDDIDQRILTAITTLNSTLQDADATILNIAQTATTPEEANAIALNVVSASLASNGAIGSAIHELQTAMATLDSTTAESISYLSSTMETEIQGNAEAMHVIRTYVGLDNNGVSNNTGLLADVAILQKQNDGIIETVTGTYDVMLNPQDPNLAELVTTAEPYASWKLSDGAGITVRLSHIGDVYIKYSVTGNGGRQYIGSYKFIRAVVDNSDAHKSTDADGFTWALIIDQAAQDAYSMALNAYDLADGKISSYYKGTVNELIIMSNNWSSTEKSSNVGDLGVVWNDTTLDNNGTWRWNGASWVNTRDKKLVSLASDVTTLRTDLDSGTGTWATADSAVSNTLSTTINNGLANVESKWAYNSTVSINGVYKKSGFGLTTNYTSGSGTVADPYVSEFWIDASRMKFTNSNKTGGTAPFTIDASGTTPQVTFNGKVSFTNVTGYTPPDVSGSINNNNDVFAQKLGYLNYADMVSYAAAGKTVITGGYLQTSLINSNAIAASQINTTGLVAENISANEIVGKTLTGTVINGAKINGAVIKASYLDLDGTLEVLTNYHISVGTHDGNPGLYTDSVYISADNEYRIPSISGINEQTVEQSINSAGQVYNSKIRSYNCGNAGHNVKCVKSNPMVSVSSSSTLLTFGLGIRNGRADWSYEVGVGFVNLDNKKTSRFDLYVCGVFASGFYVKADYAYTSEGVATVNFHLYNHNNQQVNSGSSFSANGLTFKIYYSVSINAEATIVVDTQNTTMNFTNASESLIKIVNVGGDDINGVGIWDNVWPITYSTVTVNGATIHVNNMI